MTSPLRVARVANLVREIISTTLLRQVKDPALGELSVTEVELSSDRPWYQVLARAGSQRFLNP